MSDSMWMKVIKSVIVGIVGSIFLPVSLQLIGILGALYEHKLDVVHRTDISDNIAIPLFFVWVIIIIPVLIAVIGAVSLKINSKSKLDKVDHIILPEISGIIAAGLGILYFFHGFNWDSILNMGLTALIGQLLGMLPLALFFSIFSLGGNLFYEKLGAIAKPRNILLLACGLLVIIIIIGIYVFYPQASTQSKVNITDAYCDNNGHFNFTIVNGQPSSQDLTYKWHLDDPKAQQPRHIPGGGYYIGDGAVTVPGYSNRTIVISLPTDPSYSQNYLVMDIELFEGNTSIYHYRAQKASIYWDYSTLPPNEYEWAQYIQNPSVPRGSIFGNVFYKNGSIVQSKNVSLWFNGTVMGSGGDNMGNGFSYQGIPYGYYEIVVTDEPGNQCIASTFVNVNRSTINVNLIVGEYAG